MDWCLWVLRRFNDVKRIQKSLRRKSQVSDLTREGQQIQVGRHTAHPKLIAANNNASNQSKVKPTGRSEYRHFLTPHIPRCFPQSIRSTTIRNLPREFPRPVLQFYFRTNHNQPVHISHLTSHIPHPTSHPINPP
ncbi:hypothetical protein EYC84_002038 [Monilinia fructicola]|uniref:Uncharacterized protein n=1 Tax=Monilinia fructicola TaxID=38448 RepID=A0A5M9JTV0_MONFR|nr:hypothetical protein EYC84_002038 [Monilinia fructicola]